MKFRIKPADTFIWNLSDLVDFLIAHQNTAITIETGTEGCCARTVGLYHWLDKFKFASVIIKTSNILEKHSVYEIKYAVPWKFFRVRSTVESELHVWNKKSIFGTLYGRPLWHRVGIASYLLAHYKNCSEVGFVVDPGNQDNRELFELTQLWQHSPVSIADFGSVQHLLPIMHNSVDEYTPGLLETSEATITDVVVSQTKQVYINFLIDIVAETFTSGNCFFVTEKTVRPILLKKPFIVFGSRDYLAYLRQMGFRTFGDFWDEEYDGYAGTDRYVRILKLIDNLSRKNKDELELMYCDMQYTLDHNYDLLMLQQYNKQIKEII